MPSGCVAFDLGGVIRQRLTEPTNIPPNLIPPVEGMIELVAELIARNGPLPYLIISKASLEEELRLQAWLHELEFFARTGFLEGQLLFCRERFEKGELARLWRVNAAIDDRLENLGYYRNALVSRLYLFQGRGEEIADYRHLLSSVSRVESAAELRQYLITDEVSRPLDRCLNCNQPLPFPGHFCSADCRWFWEMNQPGEVPAL